jgi:hypothetical protein
MAPEGNAQIYTENLGSGPSGFVRPFLPKGMGPAKEKFINK